MKKSLLLLCLVTLSTNLFSMDEVEQKPQSTTSKQQLHRNNKIKVGAALFGCLFCIWATLFNSETKKINVLKNSFYPGDEDYTLLHLPTLLALLPVTLIQRIITKVTSRRGINTNLAYNITEVSSAIAAAGLGLYAYAKLAKPKTTFPKIHKTKVIKT